MTRVSLPNVSGDSSGKLTSSLGEMERVVIPAVPEATSLSAATYFHSEVSWDGIAALWMWCTSCSNSITGCSFIPRGNKLIGCQFCREKQFDESARKVWLFNTVSFFESLFRTFYSFIRSCQLRDHRKARGKSWVSRGCWEISDDLIGWTSAAWGHRWKCTTLQEVAAFQHFKARISLTTSEK